MEEQRSLSYTRAILSNLMPMVVKIVGSTPTARTINESEVVGVLDTEQNKQIYEARVVMYSSTSNRFKTNAL